MDSLTQIALGAAVGEAVLGKEEGNKAMLWGAIAGTIPDLDILIYPFVTEVQELAIHRGLSHSILFAVLAPIPMGHLMTKVYKNASHWTKWAWLFFWAFFTHSLLDCFTNYGTQIFYPFSSVPVSFDTIFIIDLLYTIPLIVGLIVAVVSGRKSARLRRRANYIGLAVSTLYLLFTLVNKQFITDVFEEALQSQQISYEQLFSNPSPFNNVMWYAVADDGEQLWLGTYSWFDENRNVSFKPVPKNTNLIEPFMDQLPIKRLLWFSKGYFTVEQTPDALYFNDLRFPRSDFYLDDSGSYVFAFKLIPDPTDPSQIVDFNQGSPSAQVPEQIFNRFVDRVLGNKNP